MVACWERVPLARILMDGTGGTGVSAGAAERAWRPSPSPQPPSSPALRERKGEMGAPHLPPSPPAAPPRRDGSSSPSPSPPAAPPRGDGISSPSPLARFFSSTGRGRGNGGSERILATSHATVACWERGPLARILMEGCTGVSAGAAEHAWWPSPSPLVPCRSSTGRWEPLTFPPCALPLLYGEMGAPHLRPRPLPLRHGEMGAPHLRPRPLLLLYGEMGATHFRPRPLPSAVRGRWGLAKLVKKNDGNLLTPWLHGHGVFPMRNPGF